VIRVAAWESIPWLEHGFGERGDGHWTHGPRRAWANQVHSATVLEVHAPGEAGEGDALVTTAPELLLEIRTADCLPVLLLDRANRRVAAVHAGWRGVVAKIVPAALERMGGDAARIEAAIGPGIGKCCFEVGPEVAERFGLSGRTRVDLAATVRGQLSVAGVRVVHDVALCTKCDASRFHSFRRDGASAGRLFSGIGLR
jgi:hypothetical protein